MAAADYAGIGRVEWVRCNVDYRRPAVFQMPGGEPGITLILLRGQACVAPKKPVRRTLEVTHPPARLRRAHL
jgi:hypothetical protein